LEIGYRPTADRIGGKLAMPNKGLLGPDHIVLDRDPASLP